MLRVYRPDPPGLIHDDLRLLPPWRGSSFLTGHSSLERALGLPGSTENRNYDPIGTDIALPPVG
ncbi:hypothetical protein DQP56_23875 [Mycolicibacter senuensis]|nr:hypothetical protein DQP56_23875 [Mycolicibacter senuensis]